MSRKFEACGGVEIGIADVASAEDGDAAVGDPGLVVHAPVDAPEAQDHFEPAQQRAFAAAEGVEQPDLDIRMRVDRAVVGIAPLCVDVVEQQPDTDAAIGGLDDLLGEQAAGQIVLPVVILQVEAALGISRSGGA